MSTNLYKLATNITPRPSTLTAGKYIAFYSVTGKELREAFFYVKPRLTQWLGDMSLDLLDALAEYMTNNRRKPVYSTCGGYVFISKTARINTAMAYLDRDEVIFWHDKDGLCRVGTSSHIFAKHLTQVTPYAPPRG